MAPSPAGGGALTRQREAWLDEIEAQTPNDARLTAEWKPCSARPWEVLLADADAAKAFQWARQAIAQGAPVRFQVESLRSASRSMVRS